MELHRQLGVTYKCAWRMGHEIRKYMADIDGDDGLSGHVEIDESYIGGKDNVVGRPGPKSKKTIVMGMVERGGDLMTHVVPNTRAATLVPLIEEYVEKGSVVSTDELNSYNHLRRRGYDHQAVAHSDKQWVKGIHHTNSVEGFWSQIKRSIRGTHVHVSKQHMSKYLGEFEYRYNMRGNPEFMFSRLLLSF